MAFFRYQVPSILNKEEEREEAKITNRASAWLVLDLQHAVLCQLVCEHGSKHSELGCLTSKPMEESIFLLSRKIGTLFSVGSSFINSLRCYNWEYSQTLHPDQHYILPL